MCHTYNVTRYRKKKKTQKGGNFLSKDVILLN